MTDLRIYVASLSDYNNGRLEGKWLDLDDYSDASELMEAISDMLNDLTKKYNDGEVREEYAVHDYEGIPATLASEYMGEQDFQQLYDIKEVAEDMGVPFEVLVERAGDTGSDDYQALADSLMFIVDGNDETDIVYEYENQLGDLGNDFWSNHIYIDDVTERVMYSEDVDRFREDILYENPDMDEAEAERQAEEMADEEAERREDLTNYLEDMGYDTIPNFVSKDYDGAWKRSLSYDFDVIYHDGQMYVFSNNYSLGGTILSGMVGAYIGYQVGKKGLKQVTSNTKAGLGKAKRKVKGIINKKKFENGGNVDDILEFIIPTWALGYLINGDNSGLEDDEIDKLDNFSSQTILEYGNANFMLGEKSEEMEFSYSNDIDNLGGDVTTLYLRPSKNFGRGGKTNYNTGRSWHQDRRMHNKSESYEKPMDGRKRKFAVGGKAQGIQWMKTDGQYEAEFGDLYLIVEPSTQRGLYQVRVKKGYRGETIGESTNEINGLNNAKDLAYDIAGDYYKQFKRGGNVNRGLSWHQDHKRHNKGESYEVPVAKRKSKYADGGSIENLKRGDTITILGDTYEFLRLDTDKSQGYEEKIVVLYDVKDKAMKSFPLDMIEAYSKYAKGGMTEHGLEIGDEVMGYTKEVNELHVLNRKNDEWHSVDLDDGKRYENGGGVHSIKIGDEVIWKGNKYVLSNVETNMNGGFYDNKYYLTSYKVGVSDAILDSLKNVVKSNKFEQGGGISGLNDLIKG